MIRYPDPDNEGAEICLNNATAWRRFPDGREEVLPEEEEEAWYARLAGDNERAEQEREA